MSLNPPRVVHIYLAKKHRSPMKSVSRVTVLKEKGLKGDRYANQSGTFSLARRALRRIRRRGLRSIILRTQVAMTSGQLERHHVSMIAMDAIRGSGYTPEETRRNLILDGISPQALVSLVGQHFRIGNIEMLGVEDCTPCEEPSQLSGKPGFKATFAKRGGLRAKVLNTGPLHIGDELTATLFMEEPYTALQEGSDVFESSVSAPAVDGDVKKRVS